MRAADGVNAARHRPLLESRGREIALRWKTERQGTEHVDGRQGLLRGSHAIL